MNRIQSKDHNIESIKFLCLLTMIRNTYLKIDKEVLQSFINLFVNHIKSNFFEYRQFVLIFALIKTATLFSLFSAF